MLLNNFACKPVLTSLVQQYYTNEEGNKHQNSALWKYALEMLNTPRSLGQQLLFTLPKTTGRQVLQLWLGAIALAKKPTNQNLSISILTMQSKGSVANPPPTQGENKTKQLTLFSPSHFKLVLPGLSTTQSST